MSTPFQPIEIPPGVVATPTKKMRSSNWAEVNFMRWREGQLTPMGGQAQFTNVVGGVEQYKFASRCKKVHGWYGLDGQYHIAYLCEANLYVDTGGTLLDISPTPAITPPSGLVGGYGDDVYDIDDYGTPRSIPGSVAITKIPDAYSLDNFGSVLYAMTSADGRLLMWDPALTSPGQVTVSATAAFTTASPNIYIASTPTQIVAGNTVYDVTTGQTLGTAQTISPDNHALTAQGPFAAGATGIVVPTPTPPARVIPGMVVTDTTLGEQIGKISTWAPVTGGVIAMGPITTSMSKIPVDGPNPGWVLPGMTILDNNNAQNIGTVLSYPSTGLALNQSAAAAWTTSAKTITMSGPAPTGLVAGMSVIDSPQGALFIGTVASYVGNTLTLVNNAVVASSGTSDLLVFHNYALTLAANAAHASAGPTDSLQVSGNVLTLAAPTPFASAGFNDAMLISGGALVVLSANSAFASGGASDSLQFSGNVAVTQPPASGRGPVPHGRCFVVTQERFIVIFGSIQDGTTGGGSSRRFAWCDQENPGAWDYSNVTSQAGFLDIEPASPIIAAIETRSGVLIWTAKKAYVSQFLGLPYIYNYSELSDACCPWSPQSASTTSSLTLWMAEQGLFSFDGTSILPVACPVRPWMDKDIDPIQVRELSFSAHLGEFNEWWWFFPQLGAPTNTRAIVYSYKEGWWTQCRLSRSAGITSSYTAHPIFADDYVAFQHEVGATYANASMPVVLPYAETFDLTLSTGARLTTVKQLMPDVEAVEADDPVSIANAIANLRYSLFYRNSRSLGAPELQTPLIQPRSDGYVDFRTTGRDIRLRIDVATPIIQPFTLGQHLIDAVPRGDR